MRKAIVLHSVVPVRGEAKETAGQETQLVFAETCTIVEEKDRWMRVKNDVDGQKEDKAGSVFEDDKLIEVRGNVLPFVSRGGLKLDKAVREYNLNFKDMICLDIGASTGGFIQFYRVY